MFTLRPERLRDLSLPIGTGWLLADCMEARGKQDLWMRQKPEVIETLRELAIIQSVESSNRIEGVTVASDRLRPLVLGRAKPRDRSEEELAGYRRPSARGQPATDQESAGGPEVKMAGCKSSAAGAGAF